MKRILSIFIMCCIATGAHAAAQVATTAGSNLTAFNGNTGASNNNAWNNYVNPRNNTSTNAPTADFGNCNALILRCAQPKCSSGGCTDMNVAAPIVSGCVQSNDSCKKYGDDLVQYISAQLVAQSTARAQEQANAAAMQSAQAAAAQSQQQMQQMQMEMQMQMQQMQADMAAQNAETVAQLTAALEASQAQTAQAMADAAAAQSAAQNAQYAANNMAATQSAPVAAATSGALTDAQVTAASNGVSADVLAREQIAGQILSAVENAEVAMKTLKASMEDTFKYAGCDTKGNNCAGPKRVSAFKQRALDFFDPYEKVLDEMYDALILAQSVGIDITEVYLMLGDACNAWGQYYCSKGQTMYYNRDNCPDGTSSNVNTGTQDKPEHVLGGRKCTIGEIVPPADNGCQFARMITNNEADKIHREWVDPDQGDDSSVRIGCVSSVLQNSTLFRNRKKQASIDIETLERIIEQDAPAVYGSMNLHDGTKTTTPEQDGLKWCAVTTKGLQELQKAASLRQLPSKVCVTENDLKRTYDREEKPTTETVKASDSGAVYACDTLTNPSQRNLCNACRNNGEMPGTFYADGTCSCVFPYKSVNGRCAFDVTYAQTLKPKDTITYATKEEQPKLSVTSCISRGGTVVGNKCMCSGDEMDMMENCCDSKLIPGLKEKRVGMCTW